MKHLSFEFRICFEFRYSDFEFKTRNTHKADPFYFLMSEFLSDINAYFAALTFMESVWLGI
ncbi:MAG: hypothetical protein ACE1ZK_02775, partial [Nitrospirales bacterium]